MTEHRISGKIIVDEETLAYTEFQPETLRGRILSLHGAGEAVRQRVFYLAEALLKFGLGIFTFDFSGHGESTGKLQESSLERRYKQAYAVYEAMKDPAPRILMGNSMGGYLAVELLKNIDIDYLILLCPALYASEAFSVPFDGRFTTILRKPNSFEDNHVLEYLNSFRGKVLLATGENDDVIPQRVIDLYASAAKNMQVIKIPEAPHKIHVWAAQGASRVDRMVRLITEFLEIRQLVL